MFLHQKRLLFPLALVLLMLLACTLPIIGGPEQPGPEMVWTQAAQTVIAQLTLEATGVQPTFTPGLPGETSTPLPSDTPTSTSLQPTDTATAIPPTATPLPPTATPTPIPCDRASFVADVTYPDNSLLPPGTEFIKTWRIKNAGSCTWNSSYSVVFDHGDAMGGPASTPLTTGTVSPGQTVDISVRLKAPDFAGTFQGFWKLRNPAGVIFGLGDKAEREFWVKIQVGLPTGITYDFIAKADSAVWVGSGGGDGVTLTFGGADNDPNGVAKLKEDIRLEDGSAAGKTLVTHPKHNDDGKITGTFPEYTIQQGDHFKAKLGFLENCGSGQVVFQLWYKEGNSLYLMKEWRKACDGRLLIVDVDLFGLKGKKVQFVLAVLTDGSYVDDLAIWGSPRIER